MEQKYTTLAQEALGDAVQSASAAGNPQVEPLHLLDSLLRQENGVIGGLIEAVGANRQTIGAQVRNALVSLPSASGSSTAQASASRQLTTALADASKEMKDMGDEYISTEHLLLGILDAAPNEAAKILEQNGITARQGARGHPERARWRQGDEPGRRGLVQGVGEVLHRPDGPCP